MTDYEIMMVMLVLLFLISWTYTNDVNSLLMRVCIVSV